MTTSRSLGARAFLALLLMVGFYGMALAISGALFWVPYAEWHYLGRLHIKLAAVCLGAGGAVLWALVPRIDRFEAPGPQLTRSSAPGVFTLIDELAGATGQRPPSEVYLLNEVNAWVTHRGGMMGFGSRRVMGIGLPLISHLSHAELKAVLAHEFGHYVSGDVRLGPWIYKTRAAIARAVESTSNTFLEEPFRAYARLFLRTTLAVSREQEFVADRTAARVAGTSAAVSALRRVAALAPAYAAYMNNEVAPVLRSGYLPPVAAGFQEFLAHPDTVTFMESVADQRREQMSGEFDSHPAMGERIRALEALPPQPTAAASPRPQPALVQHDLQAKALLRYAGGEEVLSRLQPIDWDDVGQAVYAERWRELASHHAKWFGRRTIAEIPSGHAAYIQLGSALVGKDEVNVNSEERISRAVQVFTAGLGASLVALGWRIETGLGQPLVVVHRIGRIEPARVVTQLAEGELTPGAWQAECERLQLADVSLAAGTKPAIATAS